MWKEPAVFIGALVSIALLILAIITGDTWDVATIAGIVAPIASALGIRGLVTPVSHDIQPPDTPSASAPVTPTRKKQAGSGQVPGDTTK
jgi:hypothetical protein